MGTRQNFTSGQIFPRVEEPSYGVWGYAKPLLGCTQLQYFWFGGGALVVCLYFFNFKFSIRLAETFL